MNESDDVLTSIVCLHQCEDGNELCLYCLDDGDVVYADTYPTDDDSEIDACAQDYHTIAIEGINPVEVGWARTDEAMDDDVSGYGKHDVFASTDWYDGTESSIVRLSNDDVPDKQALRRFVMAFLAECQ